MAAIMRDSSMAYEQVFVQKQRGMDALSAYLWVGRVTKVHVVIRLIRSGKLLDNCATAPRV